MAMSTLSFTRLGVRIGSLIVPRTTGRAVFDLFCRTRTPGTIDEKQKTLIARAEQRLGAAEVAEIPYPGGTVTTYTFTPDAAPADKTVVLIHGWTGRAAFMSGFVEPLLSCGFRVLAIDLPGHGRSSGKTLHVPLAITALSAVHAVTGPWHGVIAHSFGGAVTTSMLAGHVRGFAPLGLERLVLIAAPQSIPVLFRDFGRMIGINSRAQAAFEQRVLELSGNTLDTFIGADQLRKAGVPTLVIHAPDDREVPYASAEAFTTAGPHVSLLAVAGMGHRRILYAPRVIKAAAEHMDGKAAAALHEMNDHGLADNAQPALEARRHPALPCLALPHPTPPRPGKAS